MSAPSYSMPPIQVPFVDSNGRVNQAWYLFLAANFQSVGGPLVVPGGRAFDNADALAALAIDPQAAFAETVKSNDDLNRQVSFMSDQSSCIAELAKSLDELRLKVEAIHDQSAAVSEVKKYAQDLEISYSFVHPQTDWEHPGKIGAATANTGTFTTLVGATVNGNIITTGTGTLTLAAGKTLTANNSLTLAGTDGTTMTFPTTSATLARTDADNLFSGKLGVGISPTAPVHILDNSSNGFIIERTSTTPRKWTTLILSSGSLDVYDQTAGKDRFTIDIGGNVVVANAGGSLCVGVSSSTYKFEVDGTGYFSGALALNNTVAAAAGIASTHKVTMVIGGATYYLLASNV